MSSEPGAMRRHRTSPRQAGAATAELVVALPLLLVMLLATVQGGVWMHATHVAQAGAGQALAAARVRDGNAATGHAQARAVLAQLAGGVLTDPQISVSRGPDRVHVEIRGTAATVLPGVTLPVVVVADGPVETWSVAP